MYSFDLTAEQKMLVETVHRFAEQKLRPAFRPAEESKQIPAALVQSGWELGLLPGSLEQGPQVRDGVPERVLLAIVAAASARTVVGAGAGERRQRGLDPRPAQGGRRDPGFEEHGRGSLAAADDVQPVGPRIHELAGRDDA